jgi:hypothetical protein
VREWNTGGVQNVIKKDSTITEVMKN